MKRWLSILIVVCVLLTASSVKADDDYDKHKYKGFLDIETFLKHTTSVCVEGDDAEKIGVNELELTDYLRLKVKNNFTDIEFVELNIAEAPGKETGYIRVRVWVLDDSYPVIFRVIVKFNSYYRPLDDAYIIREEESLGYSTRDKVPAIIKKIIGKLVERLAMSFYKVREEG